jgi:hypothetical protein
LLDIPDQRNLFGHPKVGASWEGFALEQALQILRPNAAYFWGTHLPLKSLESLRQQQK